MERRAEGDEKVLGWVEALQRRREPEANSRRIFRHYFGRIRGFFASRLHSSERAEELAQETFLQAFQQIESFRRDGSFKSWLFAIAANLLRNEWRRLAQEKRDAQEVSLDSDGPETANPSQFVEGGGSPEEIAATKEHLRDVMAAIERLPAKQQECLQLHLAGYGYRDIGELLKMAPGTARVHVHAARKRLRELFPGRG